MTASRSSESAITISMSREMAEKMAVIAYAAVDAVDPISADWLMHLAQMLQTELEGE